MDVGANKGYYSLRAQREGMRAECIEPNRDASYLLETLGLITYRGSFAWYPIERRFDRVFLGNCHHHITEKSQGWQWLAKLAALTEDGGLVLVDGPDQTCPDLTPTMAAWFAGNSLVDRMAPWFDLLKTGETTAYSPGRRMWLFQRKERPARTLPGGMGTYRQGFVTASGRERPSVYRTADGVAVKVFAGPMPVSKQATIEIASSSPCATPIIAWVKNENGEVIGWGAPWQEEKPYRYFECEEMVWGAYCRHNAYLCNLGYIDMDPGTINWVGQPPITFDKSEVIPVDYISERAIKDWGTCLRQSYARIPAARQAQLQGAFGLRDPALIGALYEDGIDV